MGGWNVGRWFRQVRLFLRRDPLVLGKEVCSVEVILNGKETDTMQFNPGDKVRLKAGEPWKTDSDARSDGWNEKRDLLPRDLTFLRYNNYGLNERPVRGVYDYCLVRDENGLEVWMKTECLEPVVEDKVLFDWTSKDGRLHCSKTRLANGKTMLVTGRGNHEDTLEALITELQEAKHRIQCLETTLSDVRERLEEVSA